MSANEKLNIALRQEISAMTPNRVDDLLARLGEQQQPADEMPTPARKPRRIRRQIAAAVLALVLLGGGIFYGTKRAQRSVVIIDADASVAFTVDGFDRVRSVRLEDARAVSVLNAEPCVGKKLDAAVQNVTEQLIEGNVLSAAENAVLLSVQEDGAKRAQALEKRANDAIGETASGHAITPVVVMQTIPENAASINGASLGKTAFVDKLIGGIDGKETAELVRASIQDLLYFSDQKGIEPDRLTTFGTLNEEIYRTSEEAVEIACADAGLDKSAIDVSALLGWEETDLVYLATLNAGSRIGYYCISARTGEILDVLWEELGAQPGDEPIVTPADLPAIPGNITPGTSLPDMSGLPSLPSSSGWDIDSIQRFFRLWDSII